MKFLLISNNEHSNTSQIFIENNCTEYFYNEVTVPDGYDPPTSYIMAVGFTNKGYFGIQVNIFLFDHKK